MDEQNDIAMAVLDRILISEFSKRQNSILMLVWSLSYRIGKERAEIPRLELFASVGLDAPHTSREAIKLEQSNVIFRNMKTKEYWINTTFDDWKMAVGEDAEKCMNELYKINMKRIYSWWQ